MPDDLPHILEFFESHEYFGARFYANENAVLIKKADGAFSMERPHSKFDVAQPIPRANWALNYRHIKNKQDVLVVIVKDRKGIRHSFDLCAWSTRRAADKAKEWDGALRRWITNINEHTERALQPA